MQSRSVDAPKGVQVLLDEMRQTPSKARSAAAGAGAGVGAIIDDKATAVATTEAHELRWSGPFRRQGDEGQGQMSDALRVTCTVCGALPGLLCRRQSNTRPPRRLPVGESIRQPHRARIVAGRAMPPSDGNADEYLAIAKALIADVRNALALTQHDILNARLDFAIASVDRALSSATQCESQLNALALRDR